MNTTIIKLPFYLGNRGNTFECETPQIFKNNLSNKEISVKTCLLTNSYIPVFVPIQYLNTDGIHTGETITNSMFVSGSNITNSESIKTTKYFVAFQNKSNKVTHGMYIDWNDQMNNGINAPHEGIETILQEYFYCYDISKLCYLFQTAFEMIGGATTIMFNYNKSDNTFSLSFNNAISSIMDLIVNDEFIKIFPFPYVKQPNGLNKLIFTNIITISNNSISYIVTSCYVTSNFTPFNAVYLSTNLPVNPLQLNTNFSQDRDVKEQIVFQFDKLNNSLNFYDYFYVTNDIIQSWQSFYDNTFINSSVKFSISFRTVQGRIINLNTIPSGQILDIIFYVKYKM